MMSAGQCTPERMQADEELLASAFARSAVGAGTGEGIVLEGPQAT